MTHVSVVALSTASLLSAAIARSADTTANIPKSSSEVAAAAVAAAASMPTSEIDSESGAVVVVSKADGSVMRTLIGKDVGSADALHRKRQFNFRYGMQMAAEKTGATIHSHPRAQRRGMLGMQARTYDARNEYPSSHDLKQMMDGTNAPIVIKTPSGAIREVYRENGVDHMRTLVPSNAPLREIPPDIRDDFVVDP